MRPPSYVKFEARNPCLRRSGFAQAGEIRNNHEFSKKQFSKQKVSIFEIGISDLPALLSGFCLTSGATYRDPSGKSKIVSFGHNYLTG